MCNPPFYSNREEILKSAEAKEFDPHAVRVSCYTLSALDYMNLTNFRHLNRYVLVQTWK